MDERIVESPDTKEKSEFLLGNTRQRICPSCIGLRSGGQPRGVEAETLGPWKRRERSHSMSSSLFLGLRCIPTSTVSRWSKLDCLWEGVSALVLTELVKILPEARFALVHSADGYSTNLRLEDLFQEDVLLATHLDGKPLPREYGGPVRLVVPRLYFWKSAKWVTGVEFIEEETLGYWESRGYHPHGDPWKEERYG